MFSIPTMASNIIKAILYMNHYTRKNADYSHITNVKNFEFAKFVMGSIVGN